MVARPSGLQEIEVQSAWWGVPSILRDTLIRGYRPHKMPEWAGYMGNVGLYELGSNSGNAGGNG